MRTQRVILKAGKSLQPEHCETSQTMRKIIYTRTFKYNRILLSLYSFDFVIRFLSQNFISHL
jgi:hypothetical protein